MRTAICIICIWTASAFAQQSPPDLQALGLAGDRAAHAECVLDAVALGDSGALLGAGADPHLEPEAGDLGRGEERPGG